MSCTCNTWPCVCGCSLPSIAVQVPSPDAPWRRSNQLISYEVITNTANISLTANPTLLQKVISSPSVPVTLALPNGNQINQSKIILIDSADRATTEVFNVTGTFNGFTSLQFDSAGFHAILVWSGNAWNFVGGNATNVP